MKEKTLCGRTLTLANSLPSSMSNAERGKLILLTAVECDDEMIISN